MDDGSSNRFTRTPVRSIKTLAIIVGLILLVAASSFVSTWFVSSRFLRLKDIAESDPPVAAILSSDNGPERFIFTLHWDTDSGTPEFVRFSADASPQHHLR